MVQRLQSQGRPLTTQMAMVGGLHPLRAAVRSYVAGVTGAFDPVVCLVDSEGTGAFGMLRMLPDESSGEVARQRGAALLLAAPMPRDEDGERHWVSIVHELAAGAAERGAHHIVADVHEGSFEASLLTTAGFGPQMQQDLLKLHRMQSVQKVEPVAGLREAERGDEPLVRALHLRCAPRLTWAAESSLDALLGSMRVQRGYVLINGSEVVGHVGFWHGGRGRDALSIPAGPRTCGGCGVAPGVEWRGVSPCDLLQRAQLSELAGAGAAGNRLCAREHQRGNAEAHCSARDVAGVGASSAGAQAVDNRRMRHRAF